MFFGQYEHSIDAKGRLTIPSGFRELIPDGLYVMLGFDHNLTAYPKAVYEQISNHANKMTITDKDAREFRRFLFGNTAELYFDSMGRILIPAFLRELSKIDSSVVIVGAGDSFEIWAPELWAVQNEQIKDPSLHATHWEAMNVSTRGD